MRRSKKRFHVRCRGRQLGPLSLRQLELMERRGELTASDEVSEDRVNWGPLGGLEELFPASPEEVEETEVVNEPARPPTGGRFWRGRGRIRRAFRQRVKPVLPPRVPLGGVTSPSNPSQPKLQSGHAIAVVAVAGCLMLAVGLAAVNSGSNARGQAAGKVAGAASDSGPSTHLSSYSRQEGDEYVVGINSDALDAIRQEQVGSQWCWAACIQLVLRAHGFERSQSEIVQRTFGDTRDSGANLLDIKGNLEGWSLQRGGQPYVLNCEVTLGPPGLAYMVEQLKQSRPLIVAYHHAAGAHAVVITAVKYRKDASGVPRLTEIVVRDPGAASSSSRGRRRFSRDEYSNTDYSFYVIPIQ
jgi:hypothetical protein